MTWRRPKLENKTQNLTKIFLDLPKTFRVGFSGGLGPCSVLVGKFVAHLQWET